MVTLPRQSHPDLLVGIETADDAGVFRLTPEIALIQTLDFFTPVVNDPYTFGQIAAANALSDVFAMGGRPLTAMNILCYSPQHVSKDTVREILAGGLDKVHEAGALLVGGHSVDDPEIKYGLAVTGVVHPDRVLTNAGARVGDRLILTKPLGTGIVATAVKGRLASPEAADAAVQVMRTLNKLTPECLEAGGVHALTDITGFGFFGHALEMAAASQVEMVIRAAQVPVLAAAREYAALGLIPAGSYKNRNFCAQSLRLADSLDPLLVDILSDPQTNGGLLISVAADAADALLKSLRRQGCAQAAIVGEVSGPARGVLRVL